MLTGRKVGGKLVTIRRMVRKENWRVILSRVLTRIRLGQPYVSLTHFHPRSLGVSGKRKWKSKVV